MSWRWMNWNHRLRLCTLLTLTVSLALAVVFLLIVLFVQNQTLGRRNAQLKYSVERIAVELSTTSSLLEIKEDYPGVDVALFDERGRLLVSTTKNRIPPIIGGLKLEDRLFFGLRRGSLQIVGASSWVDTEAGLRQMTLVITALWLPLTLLTAAISWYAGGLILSPVKELVASAEQLSGSSEGQILTTSDRADFASLTQSLNELIGRVRMAASLQEQFASDAAHELRTPLAIMQARIETSLKRDRSVEEHVAAQAALLRQIQRLTGIVESLLLSARSQNSTETPRDFHETVAIAIEAWLDDHEDVRSRLKVTLSSAMVRMSQESADIIIRNLLDNAALYSPPNGLLEVTAEKAMRKVSLYVRDFGPGLSHREMQQAFDRFYRSDSGRSRSNGGAGIGLAVVKRIVESHGGHVQFVNCDIGALVQVALPTD
ncbi:MAG: hypothetical protein C4320_01470 [Armatimonadota bacterium]